MNCFEIKYNASIKKFFDEFHQLIEKFYPESSLNYHKIEIDKITGWPTPNGDLIMIYHNDNYDGQHPENRNKEIPRQQAIIVKEKVKETMTFSGNHNLIEHFMLPKLFHKDFCYDKIILKEEYEPIILRNRRAIKRIKRQLKKSWSELGEIVNMEKAFVEIIDNSRGFTAVRKLSPNKYLAMDRKNRAYELIYYKPDRKVANNGMYTELFNNTKVRALNKTIEEALKEYII